MTNLEIIASEMVLHEISLDTLVDTFTGWKRRGFIVNKGEKAAFRTKIWKPTKVTAKLDNGEEEETTKMILVPASFFTQDQVVSLQST